MVGMSRATLGVEAAPGSPLSCSDGVWLQHQDSEDCMTDFELPLVCLKRLGYCGWGSGETALGHIMGDEYPYLNPAPPLGQHFLLQTFLLRNTWPGIRFPQPCMPSFPSH